MTTPSTALAERLHAALPPGWRLRERREQDLPFLAALYAQTREEELRPVDWPPERKASFLRDQFGKQHAHYLQHYPRAHWWVLAFEGESAGRLYLDPSARELRVMDIALLPAHRNRGVGTALMGALLAHARALGLDCTLHVEPFNPALRLYRRLGFERVETRGVYEFMRRAPDAS